MNVNEKDSCWLTDCIIYCNHDQITVYVTLLMIKKAQVSLKKINE